MRLSPLGNLLDASCVRSQPVVIKSLWRPGRFRSPAHRSGGELSATDRLPADGPACVSKYEFQISSTTAPTCGYICRPDDGRTRGNGIGDLSLVNQRRRAREHHAIARSSE